MLTSGFFERGSKILLSDSLSVVKEFLDDCLQHNDKPPTSKDLQLKLNYQSLMNIVPQIAGSGEHRDLLTHPVMSTFLNIKWKEVKEMFVLYMIFYFMFLCLLTAYILCSESYCTQTFELNPCIILFVPLIVIDLLQLYVHRCVYLKSLEALLEIVLFIFTAILFWGEIQDGVPKRLLTAVALFLGWSQLLLKSGRLPLLSVQQKMLLNVSCTCLKFMAGYVTLLTAFALSFYMLYRGSEKDANPFAPFMEALIMYTTGHGDKGLFHQNLTEVGRVHILLITVLFSSILLNLLNGLVVNDTRVIQRDAEMVSIAARAKLISRIEGLVNALPVCIKHLVEQE